MDAWGVDDRYLDSAKVEHAISAESIAAVRELIGTAPDDLEDTAPLVVVRGRRLEMSGTVLLESGSHVDGVHMPHPPRRCGRCQHER